MFKKMQWKIVVLFVALVLAIMLIVGAYMFNSIVKTYTNAFNEQMDKVMSGDFTTAITEILTSQISAEERVDRINTVISAYSAQLGLSEQRQCAVLNASDASRVVYTGAEAEVFEKTPNILQAMSGTTGKSVRITANYMDYAYFVDGGQNGNFIIYVRDNKQGVNSLTRNMLYIIVQALLFGALASIFLGYFLSRTITNPISILTEKAEDFAEGNFDSNLEVFSKDEIGTLVETFNYMGGVMKNAISEVAGEKHKLEVILENINNGIIAFGTTQEIISINKTAKNMLNIDETEGIRFDSFFRELNADVCMAEFIYLRKYKTESREFLTNSRHIKTYFLPFRLEDNSVGGVVCVFNDVTEEFNLERSRKKFVAEVSHELKTPLTTIGTYTETLIDNYPVGEEMELSFLKTIQNETTKMTTLVKNLLTLSKYDAQSVEMNKEAFDLGEMLRDVVKTFMVEAENKNQELVFNVLNVIPMVYADKFQLERAVKNIISNSMKYTPERGRIGVFAGFVNNEAYIKIEDNGIGIPEQDLAHVFDRFYRVDKARSREQGGTGLGLSIAKEIIENHKGTISMESVQYEFTRVTITLPINAE
ncbi:MAG: HAMP domain-containing protein [Clostridia bacterium]|nr:cell wall metabolism sensor histidine kinase WalK [Oscillospiraceae bacterium]MBQ7959783.1 HAMP domain-containing protein [Clostridia bacterium]